MPQLWLVWVLLGAAAGCLAFGGVEYWWTRKRARSHREAYMLAPKAMTIGVAIVVCCVLCFAWLGWLFEEASR